MVLNVHRNHKAYWGREEGGKGGMEAVGEERGDYLSATRQCRHQNDSCLKMGSDESHSVNVSVGGAGGQSHN